MFSIRKAIILPLILMLILGSILPIFSSFNVHAQEAQGSTTLYFKDVLSIMSDPMNFDTTGLIALSETPPTGSNISYFPPKIMDFSSENLEDLTVWFGFWLIDLMLNSEELGDLGELEQLFSGFEILLPNPLRIVESYEYTGNETIYVNGNVNFQLYFSIPARSNFNFNEKDKVIVSLYMLDPNLGITKKVASENITLTSSLFNREIQQNVVIQDVNRTISPGDTLLCAIEMVPGNKTLTSLVFRDKPLFDKISTIAEGVIEDLADRLDNPTLDQISEMIDLIQNYSAEVNLTTADMSRILNSVISTSLIYDNVNYPSSVTLPFTANTPENDENNPTFYLHADQTMDTTKPTSAQASTISLIDNTITMSSAAFTRNKLVLDATVFIYVQYTDFIPFATPMSLVASVRYDDEVIATESQTLEEQFKRQPPVKPFQFSFDIPVESQEIINDEQLILEISVENTAQRLKNLQSCTLYLDSEQYPSSFSVNLAETDNIKVSETVSPEDAKIIVNDQVIYTFNVSSSFADTIDVGWTQESFSAAEQANWSIDIVPDQFSIEENEKKQVVVIINETLNSLQAYDNDPLLVTIEIIGKTGYVARQVTADVSQNAVNYDFEIIVPPAKEIIHGEQDTYQFIIKNNNTGLWPDGYNVDAISEHGFNVTIEPLSVRDIASSSQTTINVTVSIPDDTEVEEDSLQFIVQSKESGLLKNVTVNSTIIGANIFEMIYDGFDSIAKDLGLDEVFGEYAAHMLAAILFIIIFFILIIMVVILTTKYVDLICLDRIKEMNPGENAQFRIIVKNPSSKLRTYNVLMDATHNGNRWDININQKTVVVAAKQQKEVMISVSPSEDIGPDEWTELKVTAVPEGKNRGETIELMATLKDGKADLNINNVFHWPKSFVSDQRVSTSFRLKNDGGVKAKQVSVSLKVNGEEKNKVQDIDIPAGGYADITLPWKAEKGKNDIAITVS